MLKKDWMQTYSGNKFYPTDPKPEDIKIGDIAWALSAMPRFAGHTKHTVPYSVAQHSCLVANAAFVMTKNLSPDEQRLAVLAALLHDAQEAYIMDIPLPLKRSPEMEGYRIIEERLERAIAEAFGLPSPLPVELRTLIKQLDRQAAATEAHYLMSPLHPDWSLEFSMSHCGRLPGVARDGITPWERDFALHRFMMLYADCTKEQINANGS